MASDKKIAQFPDVQNKLQAPTKKSLFERQKADAEAKKRREAAETKAAYDDFVKSFDDEDDDIGGSGRGEDSSRFGRGGFSGPPKRHYGSGPGIGGPPQQQGGGRGFGGDRGSGPGSLGPAPGLAKKRTYENFQQPKEDRGLLGFDDHDDHPNPFHALDNEDNEMRAGIEEERAVAKPTLRLASLPPGTSPAVIKALIPTNLKVDAVRIQATVPSSASERKSMGAIVTLAQETAANDIDTAVNALQNRYLGYGYYLSLHRHLSSAAISNNAAITGLGASITSHPFGAKPVVLPSAGRGHGPPPHRGGFAPPTSYAPAAQQQQQNRGGPLLHVPVKAPQDVKELKLIHKVIESLITHGPEFEALLMSRPDVQREEKWAWIWDPRSVGGVWYRWRLWEVLTGSQTRKGQGKYLPLFEGSSAWKAPDQPLLFEYTTQIDEFVSDSEYVSSDEDDSGDEGAKRAQGGGGPPDPNALVDDGKAYLNPLEKAKLTHLLSRLPTSIGQLRKGDVARVTAFAISHAGRGADEVVAAILSNIEKPFAYTSANPDRRKDKDSGDEAAAEEEDNDTSSASLIGIYLISDILSSSSTSGVRHAWRYRQLFEVALKQRCVFEGLGRMERKMNWGRLRAEKWKRSVGNMLSLWEGWCVFPQESQEHFVTKFNNPPLSAKEEQEAKDKEAAAVAEKGKSKWKTVEETAKEAVDDTEEADGEPMEEDVDGEPMDDEDVDGVPMEDDDFDGVPIEEDVDEEPILHEPPPIEPAAEVKRAVEARPEPVGGQPRRRPKAVDMFADSDEED